MEAVRIVCAAGVLLAAVGVHAQEDDAVTPDECRRYSDIVCASDEERCKEVQAACAASGSAVPTRMAVFPLVAGERVPKAVAEACSSALLVAVHVDTHAAIMTAEDAEQQLGFSPLQAVASCDDDVLCFAQIGTALEVPWLVVGRIARTPRGTRYEAVVMRVDVARSVIAARTTLDLTGTRDEIERGFADGIRGFFSDETAPVDDGVKMDDGSIQTSPPPPPPPAEGEQSPPTPPPTFTAPPLSPPQFMDHDAIPPSDAGVSTLAVSGWSSAALGVVAGGLGAWQGIIALEQQEAYAHARSQIDALDAKSAGETAGLAANIAYASCGALVATAIVLFIADATDDDSDPRDP